MQIQRISTVSKKGAVSVRVLIADHDEPLEEGEAFLSFCLPVDADDKRPLLELQLAALLAARKLVNQETDQIQALFDKLRRNRG